MAWAVCRVCGTERSWRAQRGARLADVRCACGGVLTALRTSTPRRTNAGQSYGRCAHCDKRRLYRSLVQVRRLWQIVGAAVTTNVGSWVCRRHEVWCPRGRKGDPILTHTWITVGRAEAGERCSICQHRDSPSEADLEGMEGIEPYSDGEYTGL